MNQERNFEVVEFEGSKLIRYCDATALSIVADIYLTQERYRRYWEGYAKIVPRFRPEEPTPQEFSNESLGYILKLAWPDGLPEDVRDLMSKTRVCVFDGHGDQYEDIGWGAIYSGWKKSTY